MKTLRSTEPRIRPLHRAPLVVGALVSLFAASALWGITPDEMDDFEDGTTEGWTQPAATGNVVNVATGGNDGAGDSFAQVTAVGGAGAGSRVVVINDSQWTGDYQALGDEFTISAWFANFGANALTMRIGIESATGGTAQGGDILRYVTTNGFSLPADGVWRQAFFTLSDAEMTAVGDLGSFGDVLANVTQVRFLSSTSPSWQGDQTAAVFGMDDIQVEAVPVELQSFSID